MGTHEAVPGPPPPPTAMNREQGPSAQLPDQPSHASKPSVDDLFEHRWRKAYEVRALERESRQSKSQASSRRGSMDALQSSVSAQHKPAAPAAAGAAMQLQVAAWDSASTALRKLSLEHAASRQADTTSLPDASEQAQGSKLRLREVVDEDEEEGLSDPGAAPGCSASPPGATAVVGAPGSGAASAIRGQHLHAPGDEQNDFQEEDEQEGVDTEDEEDGCTIVWDGSSRRPGGASEPCPAAAADGSGAGAAAPAVWQLKEEGNACLKAGEYEAAVQCYSQALELCGPNAAAPAGSQQQQRQEEGGHGGSSGQQQQEEGAKQAAAADPHLLAMLHSNRAHALLKLKRNDEAAADALQAHRLHPSWPKPLYRLAQAKLALGHWAAAVAACKKGEQLAPQDSEGHTEFTSLFDRVAVAAARAGSLVGFDGQQLEVRSAGKDAWLGGPAPHVPELDGPEDEDSLTPTTMLALPSTSGSGSGSGSSRQAGAFGPGAATSANSGGGGAAGDALVAWDYRQTAAVQQRRRTSFRSVKEAVAAARDGDRILLRRGVHNGMGESIPVSKRLLIEGEGELGETVIDQRANVPTFRITRGGVVVRGIDLDHTGFHEALLICGGPSVRPLIHDCLLKCSGDDAINTAGQAAPTFLRCIITGKKCGVKAYGSSAPRFELCSIEKCGEQGLKAMESAAPVLQSCIVSDCGEEAAVVMETARLALHKCTLRECKAAGVDLSGSGQATVRGGSIGQCVGGVWLWDASKAALQGTRVAGGPSHTILADGDAAVEVRDSAIQGTVHATDAAWQGILHASNAMLDPEQPTDFPPEEGPFRFVPDRFRRKQ